MEEKNNEKKQHQKTTNPKFDYDGSLFKHNFNLDDDRELEIYEKFFKGGIEVKTESYQNWSKNNRIFIECEQLVNTPEHRDSGITTTEASMWIHALYDEMGEIHKIFFIPIDKLWDAIMLSGSEKRTSYHESTSNNITRGYVVPIDTIAQNCISHFRK